MTTCVPSFLNYIFTYVFWGIFRVLHEHIQRLSKVVTANHRALQIPEVIQFIQYVWYYSIKGGLVYYVHVTSFSGKQNIVSYKKPLALDVIQSFKFSKLFLWIKIP